VVETGEARIPGPNGASKTTTLRVLLGLVRQDSGTARVLGLDPWTGAVAIHRRLAYVRRRLAGPTSPAARSSTCSGACAAGSTSRAAPSNSSA
jgi:ABC-type Mn2+/Zn2+ transport system ATPase subunit